MFTAKTLELLLSKLPKAAREAHRAPGIINNLLSVSVLCNAGCEVWFHNKSCEIDFNGETIIRGWHDMQSNMWRISLQDISRTNIIPDPNSKTLDQFLPFPQFLANNIYKCENTQQLIEFYHATLGYPVVSIWTKAISAGYFQGWPGLTSTRVRRFIKVSTETEMGHMDQ